MTGESRPARLSASLLGTVAFEFEGESVLPTSRKGQALLAYLCLAPLGASRDDLAELLWGPGRLANLRQELYALRKLPGAGTWLADEGDVVIVHADTDVARYATAGAGSGDPTGIGVAGELLPQLSTIAAPPFRDWLEQERSRVREVVQRALRDWSRGLEAEGRISEALVLVDAALAADPLDERLHRAAIRLTAEQDDLAGALARFERCRDELERELGLEPTAETLTLVASLRTAAQPSSARPAADPPVAADQLITELDGELIGLTRALALGEGALDVEALASVLELQPLTVAAGLASLERKGWLDRHLELEPLLAHEVVNQAPSGFRRLLHGRIAQALNDRGDVDPEVVARHLLGASRPAAAAPLLVSAAEVHIGRNAPVEAVPLLFRAAWAAWEDSALRLRASLLLEGCASLLGDDALQDEALAAAESLAWQLQSDVDLAEVRMRRSRSLLRRGRVGEGMEHALEALEIATRLDDARLAARARNAVGGAQYYAGDLEGAEHTFATNAQAPDAIERYRAINNLGSISGIRGRPREALEHLEAALTLARAAGQQGDVIGTLNNLAATADRLGDYRRALKYFKESHALARSSGSAGLEGQVLVNLAVVYTRLGELGPAWNTASEVADLAADRAEARLGMLARQQLAEVAFMCGCDEVALEELAAALEAAADLGDERKTMGLLAQRAVVRARHAPALLGEAVATVASISVSRWADVAPWLWLELALLTHDPAETRAWLERADEQRGDSEHLSMLMALAQLRSGLLEGADAEAVAAAAHARGQVLGEGAVRGAGVAAQARTGGPPPLRFAQEPHATLLASLWDAAAGTGSALAPRAAVERAPPARAALASAALDRARSQVTEQAAGLPRALAESLAQRPRFWLTELSHTGLTGV